MRETYLSAQWREAAPYLKDSGWRKTATLLLAAADQIERLQERLIITEEKSHPIFVARYAV